MKEKSLVRLGSARRSGSCVWFCQFTYTYGSLIPVLIWGTHEIWQAFFSIISAVEGFLPEYCYYGPKYHLAGRWWTSWVRKSTGQSLSKGFLLKTHAYFQLFVTDFRLCCRWCMSHHNALYQFSNIILEDVLHDSVLVFIFIFGRSYKAQLRLYRSVRHPVCSVPFMLGEVCAVVCILWLYNFLYFFFK